MSVNVDKKAQRINVRNQRAQEMRQIDMALESGLSMIQMLIPLGLRAVEEELQAEVRTLDRGRWKETLGNQSRICLPGGPKAQNECAPREKYELGQEVSLKSYERLQDGSRLDEIALESGHQWNQSG